ncbi:MAG: hypothetical protein ABOK23_12100 [Candidatus Methanoperedens sp.]|nr:hypothetical protein [Candidatus Methanoperedens sp.]MCZ7395288.1 hypothetical protein [Candidatus Methanoperedens sp.]
MREQDPDEKQFHEEMQAKFNQLNITQKQEREMRMVFDEYNKTTWKRIHQEDRNGSSISHQKILSELSKRDCAERVYTRHKVVPEISIGQWCVFYNISQGYFRELRAIKEKEWQAEHTRYVHQEFIGTAVGAILGENINEDEDENWIKLNAAIRKIFESGGAPSSEASSDFT